MRKANLHKEGNVDIKQSPRLAISSLRWAESPIKVLIPVKVSKEPLNSDLV